MDEIIPQIRKMVSELSPEDWQYHIKPVSDYSLLLADKLSADKEIVEIAALLHDIARLKGIRDNHAIAGAEQAAEILSGLGLEAEKIEKIKHAIESHSSRGPIRPQTLEAQIISSADGMAHFDIALLLLHESGQKGKTEAEALDKLEKMIDKDWNNKMILPQAKEIMLEKYRAIKLLIEAARKYI